LCADESATLLGVNTEVSFQSVLSLLQKQNEAFDLVLLSGDLSQDGSQESYKRLASGLEKLKVPVYYVPGNHDDLKVMLEVFPYQTMSNERHLVFKDWHLILLNSQKMGKPEGHLNEDELAYLEDCLRAYKTHHALVLFHHQPVPVGSSWIDDIGLSNADQFWQIILRYPRVNTILFGHVHQAFKQTVNGVKCLGSPSTCFQFKRRQDHFSLENLPPGFRFIHLYEDGCIETDVVRGSEYIGVFDENIHGH
jgi:Icc protein